MEKYVDISSLTLRLYPEYAFVPRDCYSYICEEKNESRWHSEKKA